MAKLIQQQEMTAAEIIACGSQAEAIVGLCECVAWDLATRGENRQHAEYISKALTLAGELMGVVQEALEAHEGVTSGRTVA